MKTFYEKLQENYYNSNNYEYVTAKEAKSDPAKAAQKERYEADTYRRYEEFKKDAFEELGITDNPKAQKLFSIAQQEGHSGGYHEIWNEMSTWVDLIL